jgi:hypothetical protein
MSDPTIPPGQTANAGARVPYEEARDERKEARRKRKETRGEVKAER